jgi:hypothetical protein
MACAGRRFLLTGIGCEFVTTVNLVMTLRVSEKVENSLSSFSSRALPQAVRDLDFSKLRSSYLAAEVGVWSAGEGCRHLIILLLLSVIRVLHAAGQQREFFGNGQKLQFFGSAHDSHGQ